MSEYKKFLIRFTDGSTPFYDQNALWYSYFPYGRDTHVPILMRDRVEDFARGYLVETKQKLIPMPTLSSVVSLHGNHIVSLLTGLFLTFNDTTRGLYETLLEHPFKGRSLGNWAHISYESAKGELVCFYPFYKPLHVKNWNRVLRSWSIELDRVKGLKIAWKDLGGMFPLPAKILLVVKGERVSL